MDKVRDFLSRFKQKDFTTTDFRAALFAEHPELVDSAANIGVALIDMANRGELIRDGSVRPATYNVGRLKLPTGGSVSDKEVAYRKFREEMTPATAS